MAPRFSGVFWIIRFRRGERGMKLAKNNWFYLAVRTIGGVIPVDIRINCTSELWTVQGMKPRWQLIWM